PVESLAGLRVTAHTFGRQGELIVAAVTRRTERALEQPLILNLGGRPSTTVNPEVRWVGADLPVKRATILHFDAERDIWWMGGSGRIFSIADSVMRSIDDLPPLEVV